MTKVTNLKKLVMAALNKCNITVQQLLDMSNEERVQRRIPIDVVSFVKQNLGDQTETVAVQDNAEQPTDETVTDVTETVVVQDETVITEQPTDETVAVQDKAEQPTDETVTTEQPVVETTVLESDVTCTTRAATDDELTLIKETVAGNKAKTFTKQLTGLKAKLGDQFIDNLDQTQIKEIIEARITELKGE